MGLGFVTDNRLRWGKLDDMILYFLRDSLFRHYITWSLVFEKKVQRLFIEIEWSTFNLYVRV
jgi:hypothetical protein